MTLTIDQVCARRAFRWALNAYQDAAEWRHALGQLTDAQLDALADLPESVFADELIGVRRVVIDGATWQPHEDGAEAFITPVWAPDGWSLVDMVAWHPATPDRWALRWGIATHLGEINEYAEETRVFRSPWSWLRAGAKGICPLDPAVLRSVLPCREDHRIVAEDEAHRRALYDALRRHDTPRIVA